MEVAGSIGIYLLFLVVGFGSQYLIRWSPLINLVISFLTVLLLPPGWSIGLIGGIWISCAFFTYTPERERRFEVTPTVNLSKTFFSSLWTFAGFVLTLVFLWKLKVTNSLGLFQREVLSWAFLILIEICLFRVIARLSPSFYRIPLGYGIAFFNFLMILYWIFPLGISLSLLVLISLLIINPLILLLVDLPLNMVEDPIFRRR